MICNQYPTAVLAIIARAAAIFGEPIADRFKLRAGYWLAQGITEEDFREAFAEVTRPGVQAGIRWPDDFHAAYAGFVHQAAERRKAATSRVLIEPEPGERLRALQTLSQGFRRVNRG